MERAPGWGGAGWSGWGGVVGVAGVGGGDEGPSAGAGDEGPAVVGLEVAVGGAEVVELIEAGVVGVRPVLAVVDLDAAVVAAVVEAPGCHPLQGDALGHGGAPAQVTDVGHFDAPGEDQFEDGLAEEVGMAVVAER